MLCVHSTGANSVCHVAEMSTRQCKLTYEQGWQNGYLCPIFYEVPLFYFFMKAHGKNNFARYRSENNLVGTLKIMSYATKNFDILAAVCST